MSAQNILSNIGVVAGTKAAKAKEAARADPEVKAQQMAMAKRIAREQFEAAFPHIIRSDDPRNTAARPLTSDEREEIEKARLAEVKKRRRIHTLQLLGDPQNALLYSMHKERNMLTAAKLANIIAEIKLQMNSAGSSVLGVVKLLRHSTKQSYTNRLYFHSMGC